MIKIEEKKITRKNYDYKLRKNTYYIIYKDPETHERRRISLGTKDEKRAEELAQKYWDNILDDYDRGILVRDKGTTQIIKEFVEKEPKQYNRETIQRHFLPYIKEKNIKLAKLKQTDIDGYFPWRRSRPYKGRIVTDITLNREICALRKFLKFAKKEKYIPAKRELTIEMFEVTPTRRDALPQSAVKELLYQSQKRYKEAKRHHIKASRLRIFRYVEFLCSCVRCGTAIGLQWKDVFLEEENPYYVVRPENNKVKKQVIEALTPRFVKKFKQYKQEQIEFCKKHNIKFSNEFYVFSNLLEYKQHKEGRPDAEIKAVKSSRKGWDGLVKSCSFYNPDVKYVPYQIRHTMITKMVVNRVPIDIIAKLACTSSAMINKFYDSSTAMDFIDEAIANDLSCDEIEEQIS